MTSTSGAAFASDVDGDGASELVCNNVGTGADDIQVRKWKASGLAPAETWKSSWCTGTVRSGDWNGDAEFDSGDLIAAMQAGGYDLGPRPAVASVPEPATMMGMLGLALAFLAWRGCRAKRWPRAGSSV